MTTFTLGDRAIGPGRSTYVVGEIGINHNGDVEIAQRLIDGARQAGCDAVKFQKRTIEAVFSPEELESPRPSPFGRTNGDLKRGLELGLEAYRAIDAACRTAGIAWFSSCWDPGSIDFMEQFEPPCYKIASACLTNEPLLSAHRETGRPLLLSTGMSTLDELDRAVDILGTERLALLHCTSAYPSMPDDLNLRLIPFLAERYGVPVGYSGHEVGLATTVAAVALGACIVERHITLDRSMWGSDQAASVELTGMARLVKDLRAVEAALGNASKRVLPSELPARDKLRRTVPGAR